MLRNLHRSLRAASQAAGTAAAAASEAEKRSHQYIGRQQQLFFIHPSSPGAPFFLDHGVRILQRLQAEFRHEYRLRGFHEVMTPLVFDDSLWKTSGHWQHYKDNMFKVHGGDDRPEDSDRSLKPMNCPAHCLLFAMQQRNYKELPLRLAEFSPLHRNEASGALTGLTRVRQFHQDDAHIFCTLEQVDAEISSCLSFVDTMYQAFGFTWEAVVSTMPPEAIEKDTTGDVQKAEANLMSAMQRSNIHFSVNAGDGAFYAPKIDFYIQDTLGRRHQTATIQLDFVLPRRFNLSYLDAGQQEQRPVIIHRAICGSLERMLAILIEHTGGRWPFWLSPRQLMLVPVHQGINLDAKVNELQSLGYHVAVDQREEGLSKRVRDAHAARYNFTLVFGDAEMADDTVSVRPRDQKISQETQLNSAQEQLAADVALLPAGTLSWGDFLARLSVLNLRPNRR